MVRLVPRARERCTVLTADFALAWPGPLVRISGDTLITSDPDILLQMNAARSLYRKSDEYNAGRLDPTAINVLSETDETRHTELRTKMTSGVSNSGLLLRFEELREVGAPLE